MSEIRLLFAALPTMLSEIIRQAVESEPDLRILEEKATMEGLEEAVRRTGPHVIVVGAADGALPRECLRLMYERPHPSTLSVSPDGRLASSYRLLPQRVLMENASTRALVDAIRELGRPLPGPGE